MRCEECGARYSTPSARCPECGAIQQTTPPVSMSAPAVAPEISEVRRPKPKKSPKKSAAAVSVSAPVVRTEVAVTSCAQTISPRLRQSIPSPSLIEFPGASRNALPEWRKELGERVREMQERRAREATEETNPAGLSAEPESKAPLELLPQVEAEAMNPIVVAALRRIERARTGGGRAAATAVAYQTTLEPEVSIPQTETEAEPPRRERAHNLAVVRSPEPKQEAAAPERIKADVLSKTRRVIDEQNPALNYLDSINTSVMIDHRGYGSASIVRRGFGGIIDLIAMAILTSPFLLLTQQVTLVRTDLRVIAFATGVALLVGFLYLTISVAFTGRTPGMSLSSLRVVDARTGLIPTGRQSAGRALVYLVTLATTAGLALLYVLMDREGRTIHDRFTQTAVIRA